MDIRHCHHAINVKLDYNFLALDVHFVADFVNFLCSTNASAITASLSPLN
jgi:hypothetical protein